MTKTEEQVERKEQTAVQVAETAVEVVTDWDLPEDASWDRARDMGRKVGTGIESIVRLAKELEGLRKQFWFSGGATRFGSGRGFPSREKGQEERPLITHQQTMGWQAKVREELGITHKTAAKIMERGFTIHMMLQLKAGKPVRYLDSHRHEQTMESTPELQERVTDALADVAYGTVAAPRAWAGLVGEATRRWKQGGSAHRAAVDHYANIKGALTALGNSLRHWKALEPGQRAELETMWANVARKVPETWRE